MKRLLIILYLCLSSPACAQHASHKTSATTPLKQTHSFEEHTKAVEACTKKITALKERVLASTNGTIEMIDITKLRRKDTVRRSENGERQPYAQKGSTYKLAAL